MSGRILGKVLANRLRRQMSELIGIESDWQAFYKFEFSGTKIWAGDALIAPSLEDGEKVDLEPGAYEVSIKWMEFDGDAYISRLRFCLSDLELINLNRIGATWADTGTQAICDLDQYTRAMQQNPKIAEDLEAALDEQDYGVYNVGENVEIVAINSGFGDGVFDFYELVSNDRRVGVEIEMIKPGTAYPF